MVLSVGAREVDNPLVVEYCIGPRCYKKRDVVEAPVEAPIEEEKREVDNPLVVEYCIGPHCY